MADPLLLTDLQALRTTLAHLAARSHTVTASDLTPRLRALGAAAEALRALLTDPAVASVLAAAHAHAPTNCGVRSAECGIPTDAPPPADTPSPNPSTPTSDPIPPSSDLIPHSALRTPQSSDPDWDTLAPGPQTAAQRNDIFALLMRLDWPVPRITNVLGKHAGIAAPTAQAAIDAIATLDGRMTQAVLDYLAQHWANAQEEVR